MVEPEIPHGRIHHSIRAEGEHGPDDRSGDAVVPIVELVDGKRASNESSCKDWGVDSNQLPHRGVVVGEDLQLGIKIKVEEDESRKSGRGVSRGEGLETVINLVAVAGADGIGVHDLPVTAASVGAFGDPRLANGEEVRAKATNQPLKEHLEDGGRDEGIEQPDDGVVDIPEGSDSNLHTKDDKDRDQGRHQRCSVDWDDILPERIGEFGVDDFTVAEFDREGSSRRWMRFVDLTRVSDC